MLKRVIAILAKLWRSHFSLAVLFLLGIGLNWAIAACNNTPSPTSYARSAASPTATPAKVVRIGHQKFDPFTLAILGARFQIRCLGFGSRRARGQIRETAFLLLWPLRAIAQVSRAAR